MPVSLSELLNQHSIMGVVNRIATPLSLFQQAFGMLPGQAPMRQQVGRVVSWDIFDRTRSVAGVSSPVTGPQRVQPKKIGQQTVSCVRMHESLMLLDEHIYATRPLGAPIGTVDLNGQSYVADQIGYMTQRFRNVREFMVSRLFYGGFGVNEEGDKMRVTELGGGNLPDVVTQTPASHFGQLPLGPSGADLIDVPWSDANADIAKQCNNVNAAMMRITGRPLRHIWITTEEYNYLLNNSKLQSQGGSVFRPFDSLAARDIRSVEGIPDSGFDVVWRAIPLYRFHVYDGVLNINDATPDSTDYDDVTYLVKPGTAIFHPEPGRDWLGWIAGSEPVRRTQTDMGTNIQGFGAWATPTIDPAGQELKFLDNGLPALTVPKAIMTATVQFTP